MKILIDIGHPAHVHFFKNFIWEMQKRGHEIKITAREKDVTFHLLKAYGFDFVNLGEHKKDLIGKLKGLVEFDWKVYKVAKKFNPNILIGRGSPYIAHVAKILRKNSVLFVDSEHAWFVHKLAVPFVNYVVSPTSFRRNFGSRHIYYNGFKELAYLHPQYFKPDHKILKILNLKKNEKFFIVRFVAWGAFHDIGQRGLGDEGLKLIKLLEDYGKVFITSELPFKYLKKNILHIPPEKIHDLLYFATLYIGEGGTMASEAGLLGTPSIHISTTAKYCGVYDQLQNKYGLVYIFSRPKEAIKKVIEWLNSGVDLKKEWRRRRKLLLKEKIDVTSWMVKFVEKIYEGE